MSEVKFSEKDFKDLRKFQNRMNTVFGETAYVGADHATVVLEYSPSLKAMVRPFPANLRYDYELKMLNCKDCKNSALFLSLPEETDFVCAGCLGKRKKQG